MKIEKLIHFDSQTVEVDIDSDDLRTIILEAQHPEEHAHNLVGRAWAVLKSVPVEKVSAEMRQHVATALRELAEKYEVKL